VHQLRDIHHFHADLVLAGGHAQGSLGLLAGTDQDFGTGTLRFGQPLTAHRLRHVCPAYHAKEESIMGIA